MTMPPGVPLVGEAMISATNEVAQAIQEPATHKSPLVDFG
jgi:hypothetical protein